MKSQNSTSTTINFKTLLKAYRKSWIWVIVSILGFGAIGVYCILSTVPLIPVTSQLLISGNNSSSFGGMSEFASMMGMSSNAFGSNRGVQEEMLVIGSHSVMLDVAKKFNLNTQYTLETQFKKTPIYSEIPLTVSYDQAISDTLSTAITFKVKVDKNGKADIVTVIDKKDFQEDNDRTLPATISLPFGEFTFATTKDFIPGKKLKESIIVTSYDGAAIGLAKNVTIALASRKADVVQLTYETPDPEFGINLLNSIMDTYMDITVKQQRNELEYRLNFINNRIASLAKELDLAEGDIENFLAKRDLVSPEVQANLFISENYTQEKELIAAENEHELLRLAIEFLNTETNNTSLLPIMPAIASLTPLIEGYNELILQRITIEPSARGDNVALKAINLRIDVVKDNLLTALNKHYEMAQVQIDELRKQFAQSKSKLETLPSVEREYVNIKRQQSLQEQLFLVLLRQREETSLNIAGAQPLGIIVDRAYVASPPVKLSAKLVLLIFLLLGMIFPTVIIILRWRFNGKLNSIEQTTKALGLEPIAELPILPSNNSISVIEEPNSEAARRYRLLRSNLMSLPEVENGGVIAICSTRDTKSKSAVVATNLAASLAAIGRSTILVDANAYNPEVEALLKIQPVNCLNGENPYFNLEGIKLKIQESDTPLVVTSISETVASPSDALASNAYSSMIEKMRSDYQYVIINLPATEYFDATSPGASVADVVIVDIAIGHSKIIQAKKVTSLGTESRKVFFAALTSK